MVQVRDHISIDLNRIFFPTICLGLLEIIM